MSHSVLVAGWLGWDSLLNGQAAASQSQSTALLNDVLNGTSATKDGNAYKITGTATGVDMANPMTPVTKPFEIDVNCP